jgi:hypothetical protein
MGTIVGARRWVARTICEMALKVREKPRASMNVSLDVDLASALLTQVLRKAGHDVQLPSNVGLAGKEGRGGSPAHTHSRSGCVVAKLSRL